MNAFAFQLLALLKDKKRHSGEALAKQCHVSRTTIWNYMSFFEEIGLPIAIQAKTGYCLTQDLCLLDEKTLLTTLNAHPLPYRLTLHYHTMLSSTQSLLRDLKPTDGIHIITSEMQTAGFGRFKRHWHSPFGLNLYTSFNFPMKRPLHALSGLSIALAVAIVHGLAPFTSEQLQIKWPNDIYANDKKLGGILVETHLLDGEYPELYIGFGLNINQINFHPDIQDKAISLYQLTHAVQPRQTILCAVLVALFNAIMLFEKQGFLPFLDDYHQVDFLKNKVITLHQLDNRIQGQYIGINDKGELRLKRDKEATTDVFSMGETSVVKC